jgi:hypothetical protein
LQWSIEIVHIYENLLQLSKSLAGKTMGGLIMSQVVGGWTNFTFSIPQEDLGVFKKALAGFVGVDYKPVADAKQIVSGTNYCFLCEAKPVYPGATAYLALVYIYQPLQGDPHITNIEKIAPK